MKTLILDNYDSFTYNLYQYVAELGGKPVVYRNDAITLEEVIALGPTHIVISPGPGNPEKEADFGVCGLVLDAAILGELQSEGHAMPILGVCLGHQGLAHRLGGKVVPAPEIVHGKTSVIVKMSVQGLGTPNIFDEIPETFEAMRYHSLMVEKESLPDSLVVTARTRKDDLIMALQHRKKPLYGIQFHPESIGTESGKTILNAFLHV